MTQERAIPERRQPGGLMMPPNDDVRFPPRVAPPEVAPLWAGPLGRDLVKRTRRLSERGWTGPESGDVDPVAQLTEHIAPILMGQGTADPRLSPLSLTTARIRVNRPSWGERRLTLPGKDKVDSIHVFWTRDGKRAQSERLHAFDRTELFRAYPMRDFARRLNQTNHPTAPWVETMGHLVGAESHHEGSFYLLADFHPLITFIAGQPFTLHWPKGSPLESHTPDCFLATAGGSSGVVVDIKDPREQGSDEWQARERIVRDVLGEIGLGYFVWSGMPRRFRRNLEYLAEARVPPASVDAWGTRARQIAAARVSMRQLATALDAEGYPYLLALTLLRRLLWTHDLEADLMRPLGPDADVSSRW